MYSYFVAYLAFCSTEENQISDEAILSYIAKIMPTDALAASGACRAFCLNLNVIFINGEVCVKVEHGVRNSLYNPM